MAASTRLFLLLLLVSVAWRILPHEWNMTPFMALALFAGARLSSLPARFLLPLAGMLVSDLVLGFHATLLWVYGDMALVVGLGVLLRRRQGPGWYAGAAVTGSLLFFAITNFAVWYATDLYSPTPAGLLASYVAGLPFLAKSLGADLFFTALFYACFMMLDRRPVAAPRHDAGASL